MSVTLNPITIGKLDQFRRRRRVMVLLRGLAAAVLVFLTAMLAVAVLDWSWILPTWLRWTLSGLGYGASLAMFYALGLRPLRHDADRRELAGRIEAAEPALHEHLLAAIELSDPASPTTRISASAEPSPANGSPVFLALLQERVANRIAGVQIPRLLPMRLILRWLSAATAFTAVCLALWWLPGLPFGQLMTRAMLPMANLDRVSRTHVAILQPSPPNLRVPEDETVAVVVRITGRPTDEVTLEITAADGESIQQPMRPRVAVSQPSSASETNTSKASTSETNTNASGDVFAANISVGKSDLRYRILAGDAVTRTYTITASPRPLVQQIQKQYFYPDYTALPAKTVRQPHGDLEALAGTRARLSVTVNQPVSSAEIVLESPAGKQPRRVAMAPGDQPNQYTVELPIIQPEIYRIHLVAASTGFDNPFSPKYEIRPIPDVVPRVRLLDPPRDALLLPPNDLLRLSVSVEDELPLAWVGYEVSVNAGAWQRRPLEVPAKSALETTFRWDLANWSLQAGDQVSLRAVAVDRKGQFGVSDVLQAVVATDDFEPDRHRRADLKASLLPAVAAWSAATEQLCEDAQSELEPAAKDGSSLPSRSRFEAFRQQATTLQLRSNALLEQIAKTLPEMPAGLHSAQVQWLGRAVDRVRSHAADLADQWDAAAIAAEADVSTDDTSEEDGDTSEAKKQRQHQARSWRHVLSITRDLTRRTETGFVAMVGHDTNQSLTVDLDALATHVGRLIRPDVDTSWQRLLRQHTITVNQLLAIEQRIEAKLSSSPSSSHDELSRLRGWAAEWRDTLDQRMGEEHQAEELRRVTLRLAKELEDRLGNSLIDHGLPRRIVDEYAHVDRRVGTIAADIQEGRGQLDAGINRLAEAERSGESDVLRSATEQWRQTLRQLAGRYSRAGQRMSAWRLLQQLRQDGDPQFPADAALAGAALRSVVEASLTADYQDRRSAEQLRTDLDVVRQAYQMLEAGHYLQQYRLELSTLIDAERWQVMQIEGRIANPLAWETLHRSTELVTERLRHAGFPEEVWRGSENLRHAPGSRRASELIPSRRRAGNPLVSALQPLQELRLQGDQVATAIAPLMEEARERLRQFVRTPAELAQHTADQLRRLQQETQQAAEALAQQSESDDPAPELEALQQQQSDIDRQIQELLDALTDQANAQDLLTAEGRETARDADDALAMLTPPAEAMQQHMQQASQAESAERAAQSLEAAATSQQQSAEALEQVAQHLQNQQAGADASDTRQALRDSERELGIERQLQQRYEQAEKLAQAAMQSPEQLMRQLEAELRRNPEMQEALSDIAADSARQAQQTLQRAAQEEQNLRREIERQDENFRTEKALVAAELQAMNRNLQEAARNLVSQAEQAAKQGRDDQATQQLQRAGERLQQAIEATRGVQTDTLLEDLAQAAQQADAALQDAVKDLQAAQQTTADSQQQPASENPETQKQLRQKAESTRKRIKDTRVRDARQLRAQAEQEKRHADNAVKNARNQQKKAEQQVQKAERELAKHPDKDGAKNNLRRAEQQLQRVQQELGNRQRLAEAADRRRQQAMETEKQQQAWQPPSLDEPNAYAQLANQLTEQAAEVAQTMQRQAAELSQQTDFADQLESDSTQLTQAQQQQDQIGDDVGRVAEDLDRAARHEQRLGRESAADQLAQGAERAQKATASELDAAEAALEQAAQAAANASSPSASESSAESPAKQEDGAEPADVAGGDPAGDMPAGNAEPTTAMQANQVVGEAERSLEQQAASLETLLDQHTAAQAAAAQAAGEQAAGEQAVGAQAAAGQNAAGQTATGQTATGQTAAAGQNAAAEQNATAEQNAGQPAGAPPSQGGEAPSPGILAAPNGEPSHGELLARALDDLDRMMHQAPPTDSSDASVETAGALAEATGGDDASAAAESSQPPPQSAASSPSAASPTLARAAQARLRNMAIARSQARSQSAASPSQPSEALESGSGDQAATTPDQFALERVNRQPRRDWGQLQEKSAEDLTEGRREQVSERYRQQVEAYFRVIAEQARADAR